MKIKKFESYDHYKKAQIKHNKRKIDRVWVHKSSIEIASYFLLSYNLSKQNNMCFGLCHGTRRGLEQKWFSEILGIDVIGTEISDTAKNFDQTIEWDFHNIKNDWVKKCDFIYSNSLDHSYDPKMCLLQWGKCLKPKSGLIILEWSKQHKERYVKRSDCFGASFSEYLDFLCSLFSIKQILHSPSKKSKLIFVSK